jgi:DNA invertase Pin-like site-specific DNA recombinase
MRTSAFPAQALSNAAAFARLTAEVALGHVGIVLGLEVSRLARNNADWYRLLDLCGLTEAELHILRARLLGGIRNKAARGELRRGLPVVFLWGEEDGEAAFTPMLR